jgi:hypothetical protein
MLSMNRRGKINGMGIVLTLLFTYGGLVGWRYAQTYWSNLEVKEAVQRSVYTWRDLNQTAAEGQLNKDLSRLDFDLSQMCKADGDYGCCKFFQEGEERHVYCWWWDYFKYPLVNKYKDLYYEVHKVLGKDNQVYKGDPL